MKILSLIYFFFLNLVLASSPSGGYAPGAVSCPQKKSLTREADSISSQEQSWLNGRMPIAQANLITFLENANLQNFDASSFVKNAKKNITIGVAFSGGGYRAMLVGAGQLAALDSRVDGANQAGLGGILQSSTYIVGLSGGSWLVGSFALNNFLSIDGFLSSKSLWDLTYSMILPGGLFDILKNMYYYTSINISLLLKALAGYKLSITDIWGRALAFQMFSNAPNYGAGQTWSDIQTQSLFSSYQMPYPIVVTDGRTPGTNIIDSNSTIFEVNPYELGSWDPSVYGFTDVKYLGTNVVNGVPVNNECIGGFDNSGFVIGTSSSLFNEIVIQLQSLSSIGGLFQSLILSALNGFSSLDVDVSNYGPNPFYGFSAAESNSIVTSETLYLVDGGEDGQNVPLTPLLQPERKVDVIFAYDNSADTSTNWPDGTSLIDTFQRQFSYQGNGTYFPYVPTSQNTFVNLNLTSQPTFFGCDANALTLLVPKLNANIFNSTSNGEPLETIFDIPLIIYTANRPFSYYSNTSTYKLNYDNTEKSSMIRNGFEGATRLNSTLDLEFAACIGCAIIRREQERQGIDQLDQCKSCFQKYCWSGATDTATPGENFSLEGSQQQADPQLQPATPLAFTASITTTASLH